jgi:hypothetical protein
VTVLGIYPAGAFGGFVTALVIDNVRGTLKENEVRVIW